MLERYRFMHDDVKGLTLLVTNQVFGACNDAGILDTLDSLSNADAGQDRVRPGY